MSHSESASEAPQTRLVKLTSGYYCRAELVKRIEIIRVRTEKDPAFMPFSHNNVMTGYAVAVYLADETRIIVPSDSQDEAAVIASVIAANVNSASGQDINTN